MPTYRYRATDASGTVVKARAESRSERELRDALLLQNLDVTHIRATRSLNDIEIGKKRIPPMEIMQFSRQMATFVRAGISIPEGLDVIIDSTSSKKFQQVLRDVSEAIVRGVPFSDALAEHENLLPPYFIGLCRAGELTGRIDTVLEQLAEYVERDLDARSKVKAALTYPAIVLAMSFLTVGVLITVVLPKFAKFFKEFHTKLPPTTRALVLVSHLASTYWFALPVLVLAAVGVGIWARQTAGGRAVRDRLLLRIPVLGEVVLFAILERFCRVFGSMTRAGVSLPDAIQAAADSTNNTVYEATLLEVQEEMLAGAGIAEPIANTGMFPRTVVQLLRVGEATGSLDHQLENAATYYNGQLTYKLKKLTTLIEPAVVIVMGLIVGFVALALVSAMYGIYRAPSLVKPVSIAAAPPAAASRVDEAGFTLVEILVTIVIMSLAFVTLIEGVAVFFHSTTVRRATASLDGATRNYATALNNDAYVDCAASYAATANAGTTAAVAIDYWNGDTSPASFANRATCLANGEKGAQRLKLTLTDTATGQTDQLTIVKRKP